MAHPDVAKDKKVVKEAIKKHEDSSKMHRMGLKKGGMPKAMMMQKKAGRGR